MNALPALLHSAAPTALERLTIRDFRNLASVELEPPREGMVLVGENGQGKTNLLEAIYYLQLLRSFRGARDNDLVRFDASGFFIGSTIEGASVSEITVGFEPRSGGKRNGARKRVRLNGAEPQRLADALGVFPAVIFSPQDAGIVSGAPQARRHFLDVTLALTSRAYLSALQRYRAALVQRNAAMRAPASKAEVEARVAVWEPALAEHGAVLWKARREWVERHASRFTQLCAAIGEAGEACIRFVSGMEQPEQPEHAVDQLRQALERKRGLDIRRGVTHAGPHRDDLALTLGGRDLRTYGSAGQQRTAAMALRLLEGATLREQARSEPVVLLDDPFAELDTRRSARILELLEGEGRGQTVLAVPRSTDIPEGLTRLERWRIAAGVLGR